MTSEEINKLEAGREMDKLIHERIFNKCVHVLTGTHEPGIFKCGKCGEGGFYFVTDYEGRVVGVPRYSTEIAAAWLVVEKMETLGYWCQMRTPFGQGERNDGYWAGFTPHLETGWNGRPDYWTNAETAPVAICKAALITEERKSK